MDTRTGQIHLMNEGESLHELADRTGVPYRNLKLLGNLPVEGCARCKGTGVKRITPSGRRIPCKCTNPIVGGGGGF